MPPTSSDNQELESEFGFGWKEVALGYACGVGIGLVIEHVTSLRMQKLWFYQNLRYELRSKTSSNILL